MRKKDQIIGRIAELLSELDSVGAVWLVGSAVESPENCHDIDFLVGFKSGRFFGRSRLIMRLMDYQTEVTGLTISDDSVRFYWDGQEVGVAIGFLPQLLRQVENFRLGRQLEGQRRPWAAGYWLPEALCADLANARVLYDQTLVSQQLNGLVRDYPEPMSQAISGICSREIRNKAGLAESLSPQTAEYQLLRSDVIAALIRLAFAESHVYLRGFRRLELQKTSLNENGCRLYRLAQQTWSRSVIPFRRIRLALQTLPSGK